MAGTAEDATYLAMVTENVTQAVWHGLDGFRQVVVPLPTPWPGVKLAVFPDRLPLRPTDDLAGFDRAGTMVYQYWGTVIGPPGHRG
ncbi:hypothetical protein ABH926_004945 [Catenulispora sp. GP43]|uniref:hypothetical protein n=1 Tax=Catenulispora sp. GP43 TaxID=3156263 RepID=UPI003518590E